MKKTISIIFILCVLCLLFVGCEAKTLPAPSNLQIEGGILSWEKVENASGYLVLLNDEEYHVSASFIELSLQNNKDYKIKVKATGSGKFKDSEFSESLFYSNKGSQTLKRLTAPNIMEIDGLGNVYWTLVSNSIGYKIFKNNMLFETINDPYKTSFNLNLTDVGTYSIQVQAIGDNENFSDSAKSNVYKFVVNSDGKPNLSSLTAPEITYNPKTESLEWRSIRNAKEYFIYLNDSVVDTLTATGKAEYSYRINPHFTSNVYTVVAVGDNIAYGMSKKSNSISFPLVPTDPPQNLRVEVVDCTPLIVWDEVEYSRGYILEINSKQERILTNSFNLNLYEDGEYFVRVLANGDNLFYSSTLFSEQISVIVENGAIQNPTLPSPEFPRFANNVLTWNSVDGADGYEIVVETPYDDSLSTLYFTTKETSLTMDLAFEKSVMIFYVRAFGAGYTTSLYSEGVGYVPSANEQHTDENGSTVIIQGDQYKFAKAPNDIAYDGRTLSWARIEDASGYVIYVDNAEFLSDTNSIELLLSGSSVISVMTLTGRDKYFNSPKSAETLITIPKYLKAPSMTLNKTQLSWESIFGANEYILFANDEQIRIAGNFVDLKTILRIDGTYTLSVVAVSGNPAVYKDSLKSRELSFVVDYGEFGTVEKPYLITKYEDFALMLEYPEAYFKIDVKEIDLNYKTISPLFEDGFFSGKLNGNGSTIKNFRINSTDYASGFFGTLSGAEIYDLTFENVTILNGINAGIISHSATDTIIENIIVRYSVIQLCEKSDIVGGLFASFKGTAKNISVDIKIISSDIDYSEANLGYIGGFAGIVDGNLEAITLSGSIETPKKNNSFVGFLSGEMTGILSGLSANNISLVSGGEFNGLISAYALADISNVNVKGTLRSLGGYNGLFAYFKGNFDGKANVDISVISDGTVRVGSLAGYLSDSRANCDIDGIIAVTCDFALVGGLVGDVYGNIEYVFDNEINLSVNTNNGYIGGMFGRMASDLQGNASGEIEVNVNPEKNINILVGSFKGNDHDKCLNTNVVLSGNVTDYLFMKPQGEGTEESPFIITNEEQFLFIEKEPSAYYKLANNISLGRGLFKEESFCGHFDGQFFEISNVYSDSAYSGLFGKIENATICNLVIKNADIRGEIASGGLAGSALSSTIEYVSVSGLVVNHGGIAGGLVGFAENCAISDCGFNGKIINVDSEINQNGILPFALVGGVVGENKSDIINTFSICDFDGDSSFCGGGFVGRNFGTIKNCYAVGKLLTSSSSFAGFSYSNGGEINTCYEAVDSLYDFIVFCGNGEGIENCRYVSPTYIKGLRPNLVGLCEVDNEDAIDSGIFDEWNNSKGYSLIKGRFEQNVEPIYNDVYISLENTLTFNLLSYIDLRTLSAFGVGKVIMIDVLSFESGIITANDYGEYLLSVRYRDFSIDIEIKLSRYQNPDFELGEGTKENPYLICDYTALEKSANYPNVYFRLSSDIFVTDTIDVYKSNLDGQGFALISEKPIFNVLSGSLENIKLVSDLISKPLIGRVENSELNAVEIDAKIVSIEKTENLGAFGVIENSTLNGIILKINIEGNATFIGGLASIIKGHSNVENINLDVEIEGNATYVGGVFGNSEVGISQVLGKAKIKNSNSEYIGGVVGTINGGITGVNVEIEISATTATNMLGGVSAYSSGNLQDCNVTINVSDTSSSIFGGLVGNGYSITDCTVVGSISLETQDGFAKIGGIAGSAMNVSGGFSGVLTVEILSSNSSIGLAVGECTTAIVEVNGALSIKSTDTAMAMLKIGTVGMGAVLNSKIRISLQYEVNSGETSVFFGGASGQGSVAGSDIEIDIELKSVSPTLYIGGAVGYLNAGVEHNSIKGNVSAHDNAYIGTVAGFFGGNIEEMINQNNISLEVDSSTEVNEIGYQTIDENN